MVRPTVGTRTAEDKTRTIDCSYGRRLFVGVLRDQQRIVVLQQRRVRRDHPDDNTLDSGSTTTIFYTYTLNKPQVETPTPRNVSSAEHD